MALVPLGHGSGVNCLDATTGGGALATAGDVDRTAKVFAIERRRTWGVLEGRHTQVRVTDRFTTVKHGGGVYAVAMDGRLLVTGCHDGMMRIFAVDSGQLMHKVRVEQRPVYGVPLAGSVAACCSVDGSVRVWSLADGDGAPVECVATLQAHTSATRGKECVPWWSHRRAGE
jgi:WD40 repeat protein